MSRSGSRVRRIGAKDAFWLFGLAVLLLFLIGSVYVSFSPPATTYPEARPTGGIYDVPVVGQVAYGLKAIGDALGNALQLSTASTGDVGIGAVIGYTSTTGESQVFTEWKYSGVLFSGVGTLDPMAGINVRPDNPQYKALKLYDPDTGAEGDIWFQPIVAVKVYNGTPASHNFTITTKAVMQCDNGYQEIISYGRQGRSGLGAPDKIQFDKHSVRGSVIYGKLTSAMARGGATGQGSATTCRLYLMADYDGQIQFENDPEPVRKSLSNVVLGVFEVRRTVPSGDFEFQLSSNATVRPVELVLGGQGGVSQPITFTETRIQISTQSGATVVRTEVRTRTETIRVTVTVTGYQRTVTITQKIYCVERSDGSVVCPTSGVLIVQKPFDAFIFLRHER